MRDNIKIGDKVICINNGKFGAYGVDKSCFLTLDKLYVIVDMEYDGCYFYEMENDVKQVRQYSEKRFITIKEYRKRKLKEIENGSV